MNFPHCGMNKSLSYLIHCITDMNNMRPKIQKSNIFVVVLLAYSTTEPFFPLWKKNNKENTNKSKN